MINKDYFSYSYSPRRDELYIFDRAVDKQLFSIQFSDDQEKSPEHTNLLEELKEENLDEDSIKDLILNLYTEELQDILGEQEYYDKIINTEDFNYFDNVYKVSLHNYDDIYYYILATDEQEALDMLVDDLEKKNETGHLIQRIDALKDYSEEEINNIFVTAGNHCLLVNAEHLFIRKI